MAFCGGATCAARIRVWLFDPADDLVLDPCPACLGALAAVLAVGTDGPPTLVSLHAAAGARP